MSTNIPVFAKAARSLRLALALLALATPAAAEEPVTPEAKERVRHLLSGYEFIPTPEQLRAIPDLDRILEALATDAETPGFVRARALSSFAALPPGNERADRVLRRALADESLHPQFRRAAVKALVTRLGPAALPDVRPLLSHPELRLRDAAVEALAPHAAAPEVRAALAARLPAEPEPALRERLSRAIAPTDRVEPR
jgi:HEAT repeat protein